jgi:hypothetical protein
MSMAAVLADGLADSDRAAFFRFHIITATSATLERLTILCKNVNDFVRIPAQVFKVDISHPTLP